MEQVEMEQVEQDKLIADLLEQSGPAEISIADLSQDSGNSNKGTERGNQAVKRSIESCGVGRSVVVDRNNVLIAGNKTHLQAIEAGITRIRVIETDGDELIVHRRRDLDLDAPSDDPAAIKARVLSIADNRTSQVSQNIDLEMVAAQIQEIHVAPEDVFYTVEELQVAVPDGAETSGSGSGAGVGEGYGVFVTCRNERDQQTFYERMRAEGRECRLSFI